MYSMCVDDWGGWVFGVYRISVELEPCCVFVCSVVMVFGALGVPMCTVCSFGVVVLYGVRTLFPVDSVGCSPFYDLMHGNVGTC